MSYSELPEQLTHERTYRWCVFRCSFYPDKITKVPLNPLGYKASIDKPGTWSNFQSCQEAINNCIGHVPGLAITADYNIGCIDLDHCIKDGGSFTPVANRYIEKFRNKAYIETSISGKGLHILFWYTGKKYPAHPEPGVELYTDGRFIAITGDTIG
jgi:primase-polymerase (primpol)-like protein